MDSKPPTATHVAVYFKTRGPGTGLVLMYAPEHDVLRLCRDLADFADAEYVGVSDWGWEWYGYDFFYYEREGIGCGRLGLPKRATSPHS